MTLQKLQRNCAAMAAAARSLSADLETCTGNSHRLSPWHRPTPASLFTGHAVHWWVRRDRDASQLPSVTKQKLAVNAAARPASAAGPPCRHSVPVCPSKLDMHCKVQSVPLV